MRTSARAARNAPPRRSAPRELKIEGARTAILDAAMAVFARRGYRAASMNEIAAEAGYTAPSLYKYFPGKERIFDALLERLHADFFSAFDEPMPAGVLASLSFAQRVELLVRRQLAIAERQRDALRVFMTLATGAGGFPATRAARTKLEGLQSYIDRLAEFFRKAGTEADRCGRSPEELALLLWGIGNAFHLRWLHGAQEGIAHRAALIADLFLHGVCGARHGGTP